jgi:predicted ATPase/class 3 adenylate cyclase
MSESMLPTGTVTFLFTDVEGSTRLWEEHPDGMQAALARHDELIRAAIEAHGGYVVKTTGDGFHAAFVTSHDAVAAAVSAQRGLAAEPWEQTGPLLVRMGVHTGEAQRREGDYYGTALNRAARLMSVGHGGQILLSHTTEPLVRDGLPDGCELVGLGEHRLRDLGRAEVLFQVVHPDLRRDFAALRTVDAFPGNLLLPATSFVGRDAELAAVGEALGESRVVTLTGVGGVGKTRLALQVAADVLPRFRDGAWMCELAVAGDGDAMVQVIAAALGVSPRPDVALDVAVVEFLGDRAVLLVLDNCEHLLDAAGGLVDVIVRSCANVRVLATSREGLAVGGERVVPLRSLGVPAVDAELDRVASADAAQLFAQRAEAARPGFRVDASNAAAVGELCRRLDGVPLAIELAAARVASMSPGEIARLLDERFRLLTGGRRTAVERHQTLRATVDWSYSLLDERERTVFERLGVFVGSFDAAAASTVAATDGMDAWDVRDALGGLVAKSMLLAEETAEGTTRYVLLETLRAYAHERLDESGDTDRWRRRHAEHYATMAEAIGEDIWGIGSAAPRAALAQCRAEVDNLRAAVDWALDSHVDADVGLAIRIVAATGPRFAFCAPWADRVLDRADHASPQQRAELLRAGAAGALSRGDPRRSADLSRAAIELGIASSMGLAMTYGQLAQSLTILGHPDDGFATLEAARRALAQRDDDPDADSFVHLFTASLLANQGGGDARAQAEHAVRLARPGDHPLLLAVALAGLASIAAADDPDAALAAAEESVALQRSSARTTSYGGVLALATLLQVRAGNTAGALDAVREGIVWHHALGNLPSAIRAMLRTIRVLEALGHLHAAAVVAGCANAGPFADQLPAPLAEQHDERETLVRVRAAIGDAEYDTIFATGAALPPDAAVDRALAVIDELIAEERNPPGTRGNQ